MWKKFSSQIAKAIIKTTGSRKPNLHEPLFDSEEVKFVKKCIKSTFVSSVGTQVNNLEKKISKFTGSKYVVATVNGTCAIHLALETIKAKNTEVLIPTLNFVASANAVEHARATPHFVDCDERSLCVDPKKLDRYLKKISTVKQKDCFNKKTKNKISALILVHVFGHPGRIYEIKKVCKKYKIILIEDAAEGIGSYFYKKHVGTFGKIGILSFNGNKTITTGGGGALLTNDKGIAKKALELSSTARKPHKWKIEFKSVAFNYRLPNINAALGLAQFKKLNSLLRAKKNLFKKYKKAFKNFKGIKLFEEQKNCKSNYWLNTLILSKDSFSIRNKIIEHLNKLGIQARPCWKLLHKLNHFSHYPKMNLDVSNRLEKKIINIPSSPKYGLR